MTTTQQTAKVLLAAGLGWLAANGGAPLGALAMAHANAFNAAQSNGDQAAAAKQAERAEGLYAEVQTSKGLIVIQLEMEKVPMAVASFVGLAEGTIANAAFDPGQPFFDGTTFHRVVPGHVIQAGIPKSTRSRGPGYTFPNEIDARLSHNHAGAVNMANGGPGTNASQWCITLGDRSYLDGDFTVFGDTVAGLDVVLSIAQGDVVDSVRIVRVGTAAQAFHPTTESFQAMVKAAQARATVQTGLKRAAEAAWIQDHYPRATGPEGGVLTQELKAPAADSIVRTQSQPVAVSVAGSAATAAPTSAPLRVRYRGQQVRYVGDWQGRMGPPLISVEFVSGENGVPGFFDAPREFLFEPGKTHFNPGLDAVLASMKPGESKLAIIPAAQGYGRAGLYPPEVKGQKRFVISPNALVVYEIEALNP